MQIKRIIIVGILSIGLIIQPAMVHAIYSPTISKNVSTIKQHLISARQQNGTGSIEDAFQNIIEQNKLARERYKAEGLPLEFSIAQSLIYKDLFANIILKPLDDLFLIFNMIPSEKSFASKCLRDDIWALQNLRDAVIQEMLKAYLMYDRYHGDLLKKDYKWLITHINILKKHGNDPTSPILVTKPEKTSNQYLFESDGYINYYSITLQDGGCPQGEFVPAFNEVWESIQNVGVIARGSSVEWGSIWEMAESRARKRAAEWIKANQITLTIGGENGGSPQSLIKGGGWDRFKGQWNTQLRILKDMVGPLIPLFSWGIYSKAEEEGETARYGCMYFSKDAGVYKACTPDQLLAYKECLKKEGQSEGINCDLYKNPYQITSGTEEIKALQLQADEHAKVIQRAETAYIYNVQLNSVGEETILAIDATMKGIDEAIRSSTEDVGNEDNKGLPNMYKNLKKFTDNYCGGK